LQIVSALREEYSSIAMKQKNISPEELRSLAANWQRVEANNFIRALRLRSFREGKMAFDKCLETGKKRIKTSNK